MEESEVGRYYSEVLTHYTENTLTDLAQLKEQLQVVMKEGVAKDDEERK